MNSGRIFTELRSIEVNILKATIHRDFRESCFSIYKRGDLQSAIYLFLGLQWPVFSKISDSQTLPKRDFTPAPFCFSFAGALSTPRKWVMFNIPRWRTNQIAWNTKVTEFVYTNFTYSLTRLPLPNHSILTMWYFKIVHNRSLSFFTLPTEPTPYLWTVMTPHLSMWLCASWGKFLSESLYMSAEMDLALVKRKSENCLEQ